MRSLPSLAAVLLLVLPITGCLSRQDPAQAPTPFVLRALNLRELDKQGRPAWTVTSPEARYDINRRMATGVDPVAVIYDAGVPLYEMKAERAIVINDGEVIQLEGAIRLRRLGDRPVLVQSGRLRWYPARSWIDLEQQPLVREGMSLIRAQRASIDLRSEDVQLRGAPVFERWDPTDVITSQPAPLWLKVSQVDWSLRSGVWLATGPVQGQRMITGQTQPQTLTATSMRGNSIQQSLDLLAPVRLRDPGQRATITAQLTHIDLGAQRIATDQPVQATIGELRVEGQRLVVDLRSTEARILDACSIRQPGTDLLAGQCRWNWVSRRIWAQGGVVVQRPASGQITRSQALTGRLGPDGQVVFFSPGGRVQSQVRVQDRGSPQLKRPAPIVP